MSEIYKKLYGLSFEIESMLLNMASKDGECVKMIKPLLDEKVGEFNALYSALDVEPVFEDESDRPPVETKPEKEPVHCSEATDEIHSTDTLINVEPVPVPDYEEKEIVSVKATPVSTAKQEMTDEKTIKSRKPITHYFTLNDRFLFTRELFGGSNEQYSQAISLIESMPDAQFAMDYFISELGLDEEDPTVRQFLDSIERYFKE